MPRKAHEPPKKAKINLEVFVANKLKYTEMAKQLDKDMRDPNSPLARYFAEKFGYVAPKETSWPRHCTSVTAGTGWPHLTVEMLTGQADDTMGADTDDEDDDEDEAWELVEEL